MVKGPQKSGHEDATLIKTFDDVEHQKNPLKNPEIYPLLQIQSGPKQGTWFTLSHQREISIGRASVNSIVLEDNSVSRSHSALHQNEGKFLIKDVGSRNGTFVNDKKIQENFSLKHGDRIKVGIYSLRFLAHPEDTGNHFIEDFSEESPNTAFFLDKDIPAALPEYPVGKAATSPENPPAEEPKSELPPPKVESVQSLATPSPKTPIVSGTKKPSSPSAPSKASLKSVAFTISFIILIAGLVFTYYRLSEPPKITQKNPPLKVTKVAPPEPQHNPTTMPNETNPSTSTGAPTTPISLDVSADPLQARIFYQNKELGLTPFTINVDAPVNIPQEITAIYHFDELGQDFTEKKTFTVSKEDNLIPIRFEGSIASLTFKSLPKNVEVYLEVTLASPESKSQAIKLNNLSYNRPVPLPFGKWILELKRSEKMEGTETVVSVTKYRREFDLSKELPKMEIALSDTDLTFFPARIKTNPPGAEVFVDGKKLGETYFEGNLPLGKHKLEIKKEGYYSHEQALDMLMNHPSELEISLKTSEAGEHINKGRNLIKQGQYQQSIDPLVEALKHNPSAGEAVEIQILLGSAYLKIGTNDLAVSYFEKAMTNEKFKGRAELGLAEAHYNAGNPDLAISKLADVLINEKDEKVKSDAETYFHKISPIKSVILLSSEPAGAQVTINGQEISQPTPLLLPDLSLGSYRISIRKEGYKPFESRFQLLPSTFKPIVIKLELIR